PWGKGMNDMFASLPADKKIIVNCYSGQTAGQTIAGLKFLGYDAVSLKGGMGTAGNAPLGWANKEYPVIASN
ncbi:MAG: rhodanese-like domain-containing protein, partial [Spirochaetales bacterium]|nr:rhodanese-like domain-containing protein [Spirochaetales bacterium]